MFNVGMVVGFSISQFICVPFKHVGTSGNNLRIQANQLWVFIIRIVFLIMEKILNFLEFRLVTGIDLFSASKMMLRGSILRIVMDTLYIQVV